MNYDSALFTEVDGAFKIGTDALALAGFARTAGVKRAIDLGCGTGVIAILLAGKQERMTIDCIDILPEAVESARQSVEKNGLSDRVAVIHGDLREHRRLFDAGSYDLVVSNPPYFPKNSGRTAPDPRRAAARDERSCTLADLCAAAAYLLRWGGLFTLVHRPERLSEVFCGMAGCGIEPKRLRPVCHRADSAPSLVLIEGKRGAKPGLKFEPPLLTGGET